MVPCRDGPPPTHVGAESGPRATGDPAGPGTCRHSTQLISAHGGEIVDGDTRLSAAGGRGAGGAASPAACGRAASRKGAAVAWQVPNSLAAAVLTRACWRSGAVAAPVLHSFGAADVEGALAQIDPALVVELGARRHLGTRARWPTPWAGRRCRSGPAASPGRPTSRSSCSRPARPGVPKAVLHTHRGLSWKASLMTRVHGLGDADAVLMPAPMAHISGLLNGVLVPGAAGMRSVLMRRFDPEQALALVAGERISFLAGPPTFFIAMGGALGDPRRAGVDVSSVRLDLERRRVGHAGLRRGDGADLRLPRQAHLRLDRGADRHHEHQRRSLRDRRATPTAARSGRSSCASRTPRRAPRWPRGRPASSGCAGPRCSPATPTPRRRTP